MCRKARRPRLFGADALPVALAFWCGCSLPFRRPDSVYALYHPVIVSDMTSSPVGSTSQVFQKQTEPWIKTNLKKPPPPSQNRKYQNQIHFTSHLFSPSCQTPAKIFSTIESVHSEEQPTACGIRMRILYLSPSTIVTPFHLLFSRKLTSPTKTERGNRSSSITFGPRLQGMKYFI